MIRTTARAPTRKTCPRCLRPQITCICDLVKAVDSHTELLILQHPLEQKQAKGSARLLHLCLPQSQLVVSEVFDLDSLLTTDKNNILLYPPSEEPNAPEAVNPSSLTPAQTRLIVLDGTWRKSRKLLHLNPALANLPRLQLNELPQSRYHIRKAQQDHQLSTLEAACLALGQIDQSPNTYNPILDAFDQFVQRQQQFIPTK